MPTGCCPTYIQPDLPAQPAEPLTQDELQAAREEAELTLEQLHLVQEELEVYFLKAEELSESLAERDKTIAELNKQLDESRKNSTTADELAKQRKLHEQALAEQKKALTERDKTIAELNKQLKAAQTEQQRAEQRTTETHGLLTTAQKMLEGQANYLEDLSRKEEEAELAMERERKLSAEMLYYLQNSTATPGLDSSRIPRLVAMLQSQQRSRPVSPASRR